MTGSTALDIENMQLYINTAFSGVKIIKMDLSTGK